VNFKQNLVVGAVGKWEARQRIPVIHGPVLGLRTQGLVAI